MFDLSWSHILIVLIVALVVVGPKDLPRLMRIVGRWLGKARAMANEFRKSFDEMARQSELDELRAEIEALRTQRPLAEVERSLHQSILPPDPIPNAVPAGSATGSAGILPAAPQTSSASESQEESGAPGPHDASAPEGRLEAGAPSPP